MQPSLLHLDDCVSSFPSSSRCQFEQRPDASSNKIVTCYFCHQNTGAMKSSADKRIWSHVSCTWYDQDAYFADVARMEPLVFRRRPQENRKQPCMICMKKMGVCIHCKWPGCDRLFHARCAQRGGGYLNMEPLLGGLLIQAYCSVHKDERLDPMSLVVNAKQGLTGTPLYGNLVSVEVSGAREMGRDAMRVYSSSPRLHIRTGSAVERQ